MADEDTSVRVALRIRPMIPREKIDMCRICTNVTPGEPQVTLGSDKSFTYDYVFDTHVQQEEVYNSCVAKLVEGSLEGYNATILAYGQTGSGKTYSMGTGFDVDLQPEQVGIIPRAIHHLFDGIQKRTEKAKESGEAHPEFKISAQFMELYNEDIIDLLEPPRESEKGKSGMKIHEDSCGGIYVTGITTKPVLTVEDALHCLKVGALSRTTGSTQMNLQSSRSHAIFTLHIKQQRLVQIEDPDPKDDSNGPTNEFETLTAKFHFVDLAGSERLKRTGATGERAREGISINCGLLALGNVISALGDKSRKVLHVPYRDSKLTRLLQDSLGGNSQTVMIACISPSDKDFVETLNTLNYANRARNIKNRVVINQDKSSRTISALRQEIQQLQLVILEYKQGKRLIGEDGVETVNDMFHENTMLQSENNNLRTRLKALQETIDTLNNKNIQLLAEKATGTWLSTDGEKSDITEIVQAYLKEIEDLRTKLLEAESVCEQLRKAATRRSTMSPHVAMSGHFDNTIYGVSSVGNLIAEAKRDLRKDLDQLAKSRISEDSREDDDKDEDVEKKNGVEEDGTDEEQDSDSDNEEKEDENQKYGIELAELTSEINIKQKLIEELERSERQLQSMRQHYEDKLMQLQQRIKATQEERDKVLASYSGQTIVPDKVRKVREEYERKLTDMQKEVKRLQSAQKEHARLLQAQNRNENQLRSLKNDLMEMKKAKVKLINKMKEETARHKQLDMQRNREIAQLRKASQRRDHRIQKLEKENMVKEAKLRRKAEEVTALKKASQAKLSQKAAGRVTRNVSRRELGFSPKAAKYKWQRMEKSINTITINKKILAEEEREMERHMQEREELGRSRDQLIRKLDQAIASGQSEVVIRDLEEQIENINANIEYLQEVIKDSQLRIMELEGPKDESDIPDVNEFVQQMNDIQEARYLVSKLYNMCTNQSYMLEMKETIIKERDAEVNQIKQECSVQQQLLQHVLYPSSSNNPNESSAVGSSASSSTSSRSTSPVDNSSEQNPHVVKGRRKTYIPQDLLYVKADVCQSESVPVTTQASSLEQDSNLMPPPSKAIIRVPSAPGSLKTANKPDPKPSPALNRKMYERQESTSPRPARRAGVQTNLLGKPGSMEQGIDASPPNSPPAYRRATSREENVFSRLTSGTTASSEHQIGQGVITPYQGKMSAKAPLICTHTAEGHSHAVLSVCATDDLLFSASKDRTVKVWDLQTGVECQSLGGHPNNVAVVKYHEESRLVFSASSAYVKVWDLREDPTTCVRTLCSSGLSLHGPMSVTASISLHLPQGESQLNDIALNRNGTVLYTAAGDKVRVWDLRRFEATAKLSGGHQAAVMCLAVGKLSEEEDLVITGSKDHFIKVFEVNRGISTAFTPKMNLNPPHYDGIQSLAIRGEILFSGSRDMCIKKWDLSKPELIQSLNNAHKDWVCGLTFMPGGQMLVSGCRAGVIKLWSADSCHQLGELKAHRSPINAITTNSSHIFTASNDQSVKMWKVNSRYDFSPDVNSSV
ncbi:kinesin-like protein KIF21A isoform X2 [Anabrus simplex]|uniref:kinesin-like protein KIF21A isoform X2 n=1 Tax=Anabrus simplex TaxID=316456 RepID=UPI0035A2FB5D